jgi:two-component system, NarL family, invasion response regulator UvrY
MAKVLIVDDHPVVREGIGRVLTSSLPDIEIGAADGAVQAQQMLCERAWDLVLLDLTLAGDDGTVVLRRVRQSHPDLPVVIISMHPAEQFARRVLQAGAAGYVEKGSNPDELVRAVQAALSGARTPVTAPQRAKRDGALPHEQLSDREYQVLRMIGQGRTVSEIAAELSLSVKTVSTYRARILEKMDLRTSAELMRYVIAHKLVPLPPP